MTATTFTLQHADIPQCKLLNEDPVTTNWPMPPVKAWQPAPRELTLPERWKLNTARRLGL